MSRQGCMTRIRECYRVPAYRGARITFQGQPGRITGTTRSALHLRIRLDGERRTVIVHPTWEMEYLPRLVAGNPDKDGNE